MSAKRECYNIGIERVRGKVRLRFVHRLVNKTPVMSEWVDGSERKARKLLKELLEVK